MVALAPPAVDLGWMVFFAEYFQRSAERRGLPGIPGFLARDASVDALRTRQRARAIAAARLVPLYAALRQAIVSIRTMGRAVHFGEMPAPDGTRRVSSSTATFLVELIDAVDGS